MSRFHSKKHKKAHHTNPTVGYPDSASDPIASQSEPFEGDFNISGNLLADSASFTSNLSSLGVDTITVLNPITTLSVGTLTVTSFATNTNGTNIINVNAATLGGYSSSAFVLISTANLAGGYAQLNGSARLASSVIPDNINLSSLNFISIGDYLISNDLSSTVAPLITSNNAYGYELPKEFFPPTLHTTANIIAVDKDGTDVRSGLDDHDVTNPFLTCSAALSAAASGDTVMVHPGDYSAESPLVGADNVNWDVFVGAITPSFDVTGAYTFTISGGVGGSIAVDNASAYVTCLGNVSNYMSCVAGTLYVRNGVQSHDGTTLAPIYLSGTGVIDIQNYVTVSTESGGTIIDINNSWSGSLIARNCSFSATTVATNEATIGMNYGTSVTGTANLKDCTIITAQDGTGTAKSIDAPSAQTVYIQGSLSQTHAVDSDVTLSGGTTTTNTNYV